LANLNHRECIFYQRDRCPLALVAVYAKLVQSGGYMEADFVIIGSGSAGSAMAARLSEDGQHSVIVLEYGGSDAGPFIQMPGALS
jgi:ribulose 1,5-bisphosphate synthetase/thiazole synthase